MEINTQIPGILTRNWLLKLLSLIIGACLWYFVVGEDQVDITVSVPLEIQNLPGNLVIANHFKREIEVSVRGPRRKINELRQQNISRPIDLSNATPGTIVINNDSNSIPLPKGIVVRRVQPTNITMSLDKLTQKTFDIHPVTEGETESGYTLKSIKLEPSQIAISGPQAALKRESTLKTYTINLDGLHESTTLQVHLNLQDSLLDIIGETVVTVHIDVQENILNKTVRGIPINVRDADNHFTTEPSLVTVEAGIPENLIRDTPELAMLFRASVSAKGLKESQLVPISVNGVQVPDHLPINVIAVKPEMILLVPTKKDSSSSFSNQSLNEN